MSKAAKNVRRAELLCIVLAIGCAIISGLNSVPWSDMTVPLGDPDKLSVIISGRLLIIRTRFDGSEVPDVLQGRVSDFSWASYKENFMDEIPDYIRNLPILDPLTNSFDTCSSSGKGAISAIAFGVIFLILKLASDCCTSRDTSGGWQMNLMRGARYVCELFAAALFVGGILAWNNCLAALETGSASVNWQLNKIDGGYVFLSMAASFAALAWILALVLVPLKRNSGETNTNPPLSSITTTPSPDSNGYTAPPAAPAGASADNFRPWNSGSSSYAGGDNGFPQSHTQRVSAYA